MSMYGINIPSPDEINYHDTQQIQRVEAARKRIDPGDVLSIIDSRLAQEPDPRAHPLYPLVQFYLDRQTAVDGGALYDHCKRLVLAAIDSCFDDLLELED
jgi:hypothetical protein